MAKRINANLRWVKRQCDLAKMMDIQESEILEQMSFAEMEIMERTGSVKQQDVIVFDNSVIPVPPVNQALGIYAVPPGADRIVYALCPPSWTRPMLITESPMILDNIMKANISGTQPLVMYVANDLIQFWPVPTNTEQVTLFSYRVPKMDGSEAQVEGIGDPILSMHWDMAIRKMALAELIGGEWMQKAEDEYNKEAHHHFQETGIPKQVDHSSQRLGF